MSEIETEIVSKAVGWGVREVLHWLVDEITRPHGTKDPARPSAADVHQAIEDAHGGQTAAAAPDPAGPYLVPPESPAPPGPPPYQVP